VKLAANPNEHKTAQPRLLWLAPFRDCRILICQFDGFGLGSQPELFLFEQRIKLNNQLFEFLWVLLNHDLLAKHVEFGLFFRGQGVADRLTQLVYAVQGTKDGVVQSTRRRRCVQHRPPQPLRFEDSFKFASRRVYGAVSSRYSGKLP
jgi:hypothetical protein